MSRQRNLELDLEYLHDADFAKLRTEALRWSKTARENSSKSDGYPSTTPGNGEPGGMTAFASAGPHASTSSTERAALAGTDDHQRHRDRIDMMTAIGIQQIRQAADAYRRATSAFAECARIQADADLNGKPECWVFRERADVYVEAHCKTTFEGVLKKPFDEPRHVSRWVYDFTRANLALPTREQCRAKARGEKVMIAA